MIQTVSSFLHNISKHNTFVIDNFILLIFWLFLSTINSLSKFTLFNFEIFIINITKFIYKHILTLFVDSDELFYIDGEDLVIQSQYFQVTSSSIQIVLNAGLNIDPFSEKLYTIELVTINSCPTIAYNNSMTFIKYENKTLMINFTVTDEEANDILYSATLTSSKIV